MYISQLFNTIILICIFGPYIGHPVTTNHVLYVISGCLIALVYRDIAKEVLKPVLADLFIALLYFCFSV
jgi:hypothetical protein